MLTRWSLLVAAALVVACQPRCGAEPDDATPPVEAPTDDEPALAEAPIGDLTLVASPSIRVGGRLSTVAVGETHVALVTAAGGLVVRRLDDAGVFEPTVVSEGVISAAFVADTLFTLAVGEEATLTRWKLEGDLPIHDGERQLPGGAVDLWFSPSGSSAWVLTRDERGGTLTVLALDDEPSILLGVVHLPPADVDPPPVDAPGDRSLGYHPLPPGDPALGAPEGPPSDDPPIPPTPPSTVDPPPTGFADGARPPLGTVIANHRVGQTPVAIFAGSGRVAIPSYDGQRVHVFDTEGDAEPIELELEFRPVTAAVSPTSVYVGSGSGEELWVYSDGALRVVDAPSALSTIAVHDSSLYGASASTGRLYRLDPESLEVLAVQEDLELPTALLPDTHGVWASDAGEQPRLLRLHPRTLAVLGESGVEGRPAWIRPITDGVVVISPGEGVVQRWSARP